MSLTLAMPTSLTSAEFDGERFAGRIVVNLEGGPVNGLAGVVLDPGVLVLGPVCQGIEADRLLGSTPLCIEGDIPWPGNGLPLLPSGEVRAIAAITQRRFSEHHEDAAVGIELQRHLGASVDKLERT